jgi:hypothetical protein
MSMSMFMSMLCPCQCPCSYSCSRVDCAMPVVSHWTSLNGYFLHCERKTVHVEAVIVGKVSTVTCQNNQRITSKDTMLVDRQLSALNTQRIAINE